MSMLAYALVALAKYKYSEMSAKYYVRRIYRSHSSLLFLVLMRTVTGSTLQYFRQTTKQQ